MKNEIFQVFAASVSLVVILFGVAVIIFDARQTLKGVRFRRQMQRVLEIRRASYGDLLHIGERWAQSRNAIQQSLRVRLADAAATDSEDGKEVREYLLGLLAEHEKSQPYAELPENIRMQLAALEREGSNRAAMVHQLATSLNVLYAKAQREARMQKFLAVVGFLVGVVGLVVPMLTGG